MVIIEVVVRDTSTEKVNELYLCYWKNEDKPSKIKKQILEYSYNMYDLRSCAPYTISDEDVPMESGV